MAGRWAWLGAVLLGLSVGAAQAAGYAVRGGKLVDAAGARVQLRGISHFGFNTEILQPQYLWEMGWKEQIAQIKALGFNVVRLPFVPDVLHETLAVEILCYLDPALNRELLGKTPLQVLDLWMAEADRQGLYVLLDFQSVSRHTLYPTWFVDDPLAYGPGGWAQTWNALPYTRADWIRDLAFLAQRYAHLPHFLGLDLFNEPHGDVRWNTGETKFRWKGAAEEAAAAVLAANPNLLVFVQGTMHNRDGIEDSTIPMNWGENLQAQAYDPLAIPAGKLVLAPHSYGPDVFMKDTFSAPGYPGNLAADWETLFGQLSPQYAVVIGEWGGRYGIGGTGWLDVQWQEAFVDYLLARGIDDTFYWAYTPNASDTGGILDDDLNVREDKLALLQRLWDGAVPVTDLPVDAPASPAPATGGGGGGAVGFGLLLLLTAPLLRVSRGRRCAGPWSRAGTACRPRAS